VVTERLNELFECPSPAFRALFPRGMPVKACLRRQAELRILRDGKGRRTGAEAVHPVCALECERGRANLARAAVPLSACGTCGSAQVGNSTCPTCAEERAAHVVQPREAPRPPPQGLIWTDQAPDAPIAPPRPRALAFGDDVLEDLTRRVAEAEERRAQRDALQVRGSAGPAAEALGNDRARTGNPQSLGAPVPGTAAAQHEERPMRAVPTPPTPIAAPVNPEQPANEPAEERTMPRGKRETPCEGCGATGMRHRKDCKEKLAPKTAEKPVRAVRQVTRKPARPHEMKLVRQLVELIRLHEAALVDLRAELRARRDEIGEALGESKAA
jgi:ribosomal protein L32